MKEHPVDIIRCKDGSDTLFSGQFGQHYHNPNGAVEESRYVFFEQSGLLTRLRNKQPCRIVEIGFGTGLNVLLMADYVQKLGSTDQAHHFYSVEAFPITANDFLALNYGEFVENSDLISDIAQFFEGLTPGANYICLLGCIHLHVFVGFFEAMPLGMEAVDVIFQDAFSPEVNAELWQPEVFGRLRGISSAEAVLVTYGAASAARAAMAKGGWFVGRTRGALGKREMTVASVSERVLTAMGVNRVNEQRLIERWDAGELRL